jgi:hypothetical protein
VTRQTAGPGDDFPSNNGICASGFGRPRVFGATRDQERLERRRFVHAHSVIRHPGSWQVTRRIAEVPGERTGLKLGGDMIQS